MDPILSIGRLAGSNLQGHVKKPVLSTVAGRFGMVMRRTLLEEPMSDVLMVIIVIGLVFFTAWLSKLSAQMHDGLNGLGATDDDIQEIKEGIEIVAAVLNKLPDLMPSFQMNTNPLQPIFEAIARSLSGEEPLKTYEGTRNTEGEFIGTSEIEETHDTP